MFPLIRTGHEPLHEFPTCSEWSDKARGFHDSRRDHGYWGAARKVRPSSQRILFTWSWLFSFPSTSNPLCLTPHEVQEPGRLLPHFVTSPIPYPTLRRIHLHCYEYQCWEELSRDLLSTNSEHLAFVGTCSQMAHHWFTIQFSYCEAKNVFCSVSLSAASGRRQGKVPPLPSQTVRWLWGSPAAQTQKGWARGEEGPDHASVKGLGHLCPLNSSRKGI